MYMLLCCQQLAEHLKGSLYRGFVSVYLSVCWIITLFGCQARSGSHTLPRATYMIIEHSKVIPKDNFLLVHENV